MESFKIKCSQCNHTSKISEICENCGYEFQFIAKTDSPASKIKEEEIPEIPNVDIIPLDTPHKSLREEFEDTKQLLEKRFNSFVDEEEQEEDEAYRKMMENHYETHRKNAYIDYPLDSIKRLSVFDPTNEINPELFESLSNRKKQHTRQKKKLAREARKAKRNKKNRQRAADWSIGDRCEVQLKSIRARGVIRFIGETEFSDGEWIGVELDHPVGKNDGSVNRVPYFECFPLHGVFLRASHIEVGNFPVRDDEAPTYVLRDSLDPHRGRSSMRTNSPWIPRKKSGFVPNPYFLPKNKRPRNYRHPERHAEKYRESITDNRNIFVKLTDHTLYTGTHKHRFNPDGSGRGKHGRHSIVKGQGSIYNW